MKQPECSIGDWSGRWRSSSTVGAPLSAAERGTSGWKLGMGMARSFHQDVEAAIVLGQDVESGWRPRCRNCALRGSP
jgi:hypothetical protein